MDYILTDNTLTIIRDNGLPATITSSDNAWDAAIEALRAEDFDRLLRLVDPVNTVREFTRLTERVSIDESGTQLLLDGEPIPSDLYIVDRILQIYEQGLPVEPLARFLERLMKNPSRRVVRHLLEFLEYGHLPITEDGHFLAYKKIRRDYKDIYTGTIDNSIGTTVQVPRNMVDENPDNTCSHGLHLCSYGYLAFYGTGRQQTRVVICDVDPADVVAIPRDYENTKMRVCRYRVVRELESAHDELRDQLIV